jgi:hypothetical protein
MLCERITDHVDYDANGWPQSSVFAYQSADGGPNVVGGVKIEGVYDPDAELTDLDQFNRNDELSDLAEIEEAP